MKYPNFSKVFTDYFGDKPRKITYEIRYDYLLHDISFMRDLIHDARFFRSKIKHQGDQVSFLLKRDCFELPTFRKEKPQPHYDLYVTDSKLTFTKVIDMKWRFREAGWNLNDQIVKSDTELWIDYIHIDEDYYIDDMDTFHVIIAGYDWRCVIELSKYDSTIKLRDSKVPALHSEKK